MKRSFTFSFSRKVSVAPYETAEFYEAEGFEMDSYESPMSLFETHKDEVIRRVRKAVDDMAEAMR